MAGPDDPLDDSDDGGDTDLNLIDADCPCILCTYNLRGLNPHGRCPECGTDIARTMRQFRKQAVCPVCMAPNLAIASICAKCGSPLSSAAATANYFAPTPLAWGPPKDQAEQAKAVQAHTREAARDLLKMGCLTLVLVIIVAVLMAVLGGF